MRRLYLNNVVLITCSVIILILIVFSNTLHVSAVGTPTATPSPVSTAQLPDSLATQQAQITNLSEKIDNVEKRSDNLQINEVEGRLNDKLNTILSVAAVITLIAAFFGIRSYSEIDKVVKERVAEAVDNEILGFDPRILPIRLQLGRKQEKVQQMLSASRVGNVEWFSTLDERNLNGVNVVTIETEADEASFVNFLEQYRKSQKMDPSRVAFVLYTIGGHRIDPKTMSLFENLPEFTIVTSNMAVTVVSAALLVARSLKTP